MLSRLSPRHGSRHPKKRVGRGPGSGTGKTSSRGNKGQGHRSAGRETPFHFEGGQMSIVRRLPKRGFHNPFGTSYRIVNLSALAVFGDGATVDPKLLEERGLIKHGRDGVKLLAEGDAPKGLRISVHKASAAAVSKVLAAGGSVEVLG